MNPALTLIESPWRANPRALNEAAEYPEYARRALHDSIDRGEVPIASHLLYTQVLDDNDPAEREQGIRLGLAWLTVANQTAVYEDYGISAGMQLGLEAARAAGVPVLFRKIGRNPGSENG